MSSDTPHMPSELWNRLREESAEDRSDLEAVWALLGTVDPPGEEEADPERAWADLVRRHPELDATPQDGRQTQEDRSGAREASRRRQRPARTSRRSRRRTWTWGLALALVALLGGVWLWQQPVTVTAPDGQQHSVTLPDGSTVELNSHTRLTYRRGFQSWPFVEADRRSVQLEGEAYFDVATGERVFTVVTSNARVTVEGTRFNVRARVEEDTITEVTMVHGRVQVAPRQHPDRSVALADSGHTSRVAGSESAPTTPRFVPLDRILAWRDDGFAVRAQPLSSVLRELERRYEATVQLHSSVDRSDDRISLYYPGPTDLETILHDLCTARDLKYRSTSRGFEVFAAPSPQ